MGNSGEIRLSKNKRGKWYFIAVAGNGKTLSTSESYSSITAATKGVASLLRMENPKVVKRNYNKNANPEFITMEIGK